MNMDTNHDVPIAINQRLIKCDNSCHRICSPTNGAIWKFSHIAAQCVMNRSPLDARLEQLGNISALVLLPGDTAGMQRVGVAAERLAIFLYMDAQPTHRLMQTAFAHYWFSIALSVEDLDSHVNEMETIRFAMLGTSLFVELDKLVTNASLRVQTTGSAHQQIAYLTQPKFDVDHPIRKANAN
ncbi:hypothetical protein T265_05935 [Opisthorchis viverrini]|uniref:Uncharacterized protein n=1 Tax=Opisthorchis viverrini TaxID=6198 RepID=A0A074ZM79_OPIVI|nr:hypothetical protein T265_05935 [Opisthorchis viverrini]KER26877.1 hypothetical protein T265_05935 [Opisthorchis viverrini]